MRRVAAIVIVALFAGACGEPSIPPATALDLQARVADIRSVIEEGRVFAARQQLDKLTNLVGRLLDDGVIDELTAMDIIEAVETVRNALVLAPERSPSPTETSTTPPPSPTDEPGDHGEGKGKGKGNEGKGKGHGND
jgi:hypothetical protein